MTSRRPRSARALWLVGLAGCQLPGAGTPTTRPAPPPHVYLLTDLIRGGSWQAAPHQGATTPRRTPRLRPRPAPPPHVYLLTDLIGGWSWQLRTSEASTTRVETEAWRLRTTVGIPTQLSGRYVREVEVRSDDRVPFACNQRPVYRQRAIYDVTVEATPRAFAVRET